MSAAWRAPPWKTSRWRRKSAALRCTTTSPTRTTRAGGHRLPSRRHRQSPAAGARQRERSRSLAEHGDHRSEAHQSKGGCPLGRSLVTRRERPRGRALIAAGFDQWAAAIGDATQIPSCRRETPVRHRPGRPRHYSARHAPRRTSARPGTPECPSVRNCGRHPPRSCHRQMSPSLKIRWSQARGVERVATKVQCNRCFRRSPPCCCAGSAPAACSRASRIARNGLCAPGDRAGYQPARREFSLTEGAARGTRSHLGPGGRDQRGFAPGIIVLELGQRLGSR